MAARVPAKSLHCGHVCELRGRREQPYTLHCILSRNMAWGRGGVAHQTSVVVARRYVGHARKISRLLQHLLLGVCL